ncbi:hypothetical protein KDA_30930 [Dictyobacter alpinus]|uniref:Carrier domain-containing protein n=1 Tax=Dictyobacter alpinus TaxID=2014873 RepID=A0A402B8F2_9CHLR|nr:non-ribosomal peptide synthetase [Dictyobacter alpinus]GCE27609.1 hypothetical protein KDA_30930 [Dictyobacter alpinus]
MDKHEIEAIYPLSPMQQGMLFHYLYEPQAGLYFEQMQCHMPAGLEVAAFRQAWQQLVSRHSILRTQFMWENLKEPRQIVRYEVDLPWVEMDWQHLDEQEQRKQFLTLLASDRALGVKMTQAPLLRITLIQLAAHHFECIVSFHHLILDGWSMPVLLNELFVLYAACVQQVPAELATPRPYRDYIAWLQRQDQKQAETFWREHLKGFRTPLVLSVDSGTGKSPGVGYGEATQHCLPQTVQTLRQMARRYKLTINTIVQGAWALLLSRYSGTNDIVFGGVVSGRPPDLQGVEQMIGLFINTLPIRIRVSTAADRSIATWLQAIQLQQIEARQYEYSSLAQVQGWSDVPHGQALFESILVFENYPVEAHAGEDGGGLQMKIDQALEQTNYPLSLEVSFNALQFSLRLVFDQQRFDDRVASTLLTHFCSILEQMLSQMDGSVAALSPLTVEERRQMMVEWNDTREEYPATTSVHTLFEAQVERTPHAPALKSEEGILTYAQVNERANQLAHLLQTLQVGPDVLVGLALERGPLMVIALLAVLKAGGAYVPLDPSYPSERLAFMLQDTALSVLLTSQQVVERFPDVTVAHRVMLDVDWPLIQQQGIDNLMQQLEPENLAYIIYTSGSTGQPKGTLISQRGLMNYLHWCNRYYHVQAGSGSIVHSSLAFDLTVTSLFPALLSGGCVVLVPEEQDMVAVSEILRQHNDFSVLKITPAHLELLNRLLEPEEMAGIARALVIGGEMLQGDSLTLWRTYAPATRIINEYGPTETVVGCCIYEVADGASLQGPVPIGRPIANTQLYILDAALLPVPIGVAGELYISGDGLARGYLQRPDLTAERFIADPFSQELGSRMYKTGDLARYRVDGTIEFLGRIDHQVKVHGYRIELGEIEAVLRQHAAIQEAVVVVRAQAGTMDKRLAAYVTIEGDQTSAIKAIKAFLKEKLPDYMLPSIWVVMDEFPLTSNGKVDRSALPEPEEVYAVPAANETEQTLSSVEELLVEIWSRVLQVQSPDIHANFFELGGDSIQGIQIIDQARRRDLRLTLKQLFQSPTIAELAGLIEAAPEQLTEQGAVTGRVPLTPIEHWFFEQELAERQHWNQSMVLEGWQVVQPAILEKALTALLVQHDALRLCFVAGHAGWRQENAAFNGETPFQTIDLSAYSEEEQEQRLRQTEAEIQASLNLESGPLLRMALFEMGKCRPNRILIVVHHLAIDSVSWRILLEDLQTAYQQLVQGQPVRLTPKTTSFKRYAEHLIIYAQSDEVAREIPYWIAVTRHQSSALPLDYPEGMDLNTEGSVQTIACSLDEEETHLLLHKVPEAYHTQINDVLLTALVQTYAEWTGQRSVLVDMEGHGREDLLENGDLSHTVGWFTTLFPVLLDIEQAQGPGEALRTVKELLRRIPNHGLGYGVLRYLHPDEEVRARLRNRASISFNYLGQFDQKQTGETLLGRVREADGLTRSPRAKRCHVLDIGGAVVDGQLTMHWSFSARLHRPEQIERLAEMYRDKLRALIQHCLIPDEGAYTPSDFPLAQLSDEKLDALSMLIGELDEEEATL